MNNRDYWRKRFEYDKAQSIKSSQEYEESLNKRLNQLLYIYNQEIKQWYRRYSNDLGIPLDEVIEMLDKIEYKHFDMTLQEFKRKAIKGGYEKELDQQYFNAQISRLKQLESQLKSRATALFSVEQIKMQDELINQYQDTYYHNTYNIQDYRGFFTSNFATLDHELVKHIISKPWAKDGKDFSERIWGNYVNELPSQLMDSLLRSTLKGSSYQKVERDFRERFVGVKSKHIHRLVISEMGHAQESASAAAYLQQGVEKYRYLATFERNTCSICSKMDNVIFNVKDMVTGKNYPLIHAYCRCTTTPYFEGNPVSTKRFARNPDGTSEIVEDMSFDEWMDKIS